MIVNIQVITNRALQLPGLKISKLSRIDTFDSYDYNVIDLSSDDIWRYSGNGRGVSNLALDLRSLRKMISDSRKARFVFILPRNATFLFNYNFYTRRFDNGIPLRDDIEGMRSVLSEIIDLTFSLAYEPNKTLIDGKKVCSDFYFNYVPLETQKLLSALDSEKVTAIKHGRDVYTTIDILEGGVIEPFIRLSFPNSESDLAPWVDQYEFNRDSLIREEISRKETEKEKLVNEISNLNDGLEKNRFYKAILCLTGQELVNRVFEILRLTLGVDLSGFVDNYKEDFCFVIDGTHFVGEIKGVNENVKNKHIAELEHNKQEYLDVNGADEAKGLLVISHQRKTCPEERHAIDDKQIQYAKKCGILIIEMTTLLSIFDAYLNNCLNKDKLLETLKNSNGLLRDEWR